MYELVVNEPFTLEGESFTHGSVIKDFDKMARAKREYPTHVTQKLALPEQEAPAEVTAEDNVQSFLDLEEDPAPKSGKK